MMLIRSEALFGKLLAVELTNQARVLDVLDKAQINEIFRIGIGRLRPGRG